MRTGRTKRVSKVEELVSASDLASAWQCHPTTAARILKRAGVEPVTFTNARNGMKRWRRVEVEAFLRESADR